MVNSTKHFDLMKNFLLVIPLLVSIPLSSARAEEAALRDFTAAEIVKLVNLSMALKKTQLTGSLRKGNLVAPLVFKLEDKAPVKEITFSFGNPPQAILLDLKQDSFLLYDVMGGKKIPVSDKNYAMGIKGMDMTYEDMSFRYLYWPNPVKLESETYSTRRCWKVQCNNPNPSVGAYKTVVIWVDQASGGLMKMEGYNYQSINEKPVFTLLKRCKVTAGMKIKGTAGEDVTVLKEMTIESFDPTTGKGLGKTFLEMDKPNS